MVHANHQVVEEGDIQDFYKDANILITGATGFVGKILVEKLLRSCRGIKSINIMLRMKKGNEGEKRFKEYLDNEVAK